MGDSLGAPLEFSGYNTREKDTVTDLDDQRFSGQCWDELKKQLTFCHLVDHLLFPTTKPPSPSPRPHGRWL